MIINIKVNNMTGGSRMAAAPGNELPQMENNNAKILALERQIKNLQELLRISIMNVETSAMKMHNITKQNLSEKDFDNMVSQLQQEWSTNSSKANKVKTQLKTLEKQINTLREQNRILLAEYLQMAGRAGSRRNRNPSPTYTDLSEEQIENTAPRLEQGIPTMMRTSSYRRTF